MGMSSDALIFQDEHSHGHGPSQDLACTAPHLVSAGFVAVWGLADLCCPLSVWHQVSGLWTPSVFSQGNPGDALFPFFFFFHDSQ